MALICVVTSQSTRSGAWSFPGLVSAAETPAELYEQLKADQSQIIYSPSAPAQASLEGFRADGAAHD